MGLAAPPTAVGNALHSWHTPIAQGRNTVGTPVASVDVAAPAARWGGAAATLTGQGPAAAVSNAAAP